MRFDVTGRSAKNFIVSLLTIFFTIFVQTNLKRILLVEFVLWMEHDSLLKEKNDTKKKRLNKFRRFGNVKRVTPLWKTYLKITGEINIYNQLFSCFPFYFVEF